MFNWNWKDYMASQETTPDHHFWLELDPKEKAALTHALHGRDTDLTGKQLTALREQVKVCRRVEGPKLMEARLDWDELEQTALKQGCSQVDVIFDRAKGKE